MAVKTWILPTVLAKKGSAGQTLNRLLGVRDTIYGPFKGQACSQGWSDFPKPWVGLQLLGVKICLIHTHTETLKNNGGKSSLVARIQCFHCRGPRSIPGWETIPHTTRIQIMDTGKVEPSILFRSSLNCWNWEPDIRNKPPKIDPERHFLLRASSHGISM